MAGKQTVASLNANITANTTSLDSGMKRSSRLLSRTRQSMTRDAKAINDNVSGGFKNMARNAALMEGPLGGVAGRLTTLSTIASTGGVALLGISAAVAGLTIVMAKAAKTGDEWEGSQRRVIAILKATDGASGQTAEGIRAFSQELAAGTLASVAGVEKAAAKLLTFRKVSGDTFKQTLTLAQDLAATGIGTLEGNVIQLGKALQDPVTQLSALARNGITFSDAQKEMITGLVESNDLLAAQAIILNELNNQVGGAGAAEGGDVAQQADLLGQRFEEMFVALDKALGVSDKFASVLSAMANAINEFNKNINPSKQDQFNTAVEEGNTLIKQRNAIDSLGQIGAKKQLDDLDRKIAANNALQSSLARQIEREEHLRAAAENRAKWLQQQTQEEEQAAQDKLNAADAETKAQEKLDKIEERRQAKTKDTIETLEREGEALRLKNRLLGDSTVSIEEASSAAQIQLQWAKLGLTLNDEEAKKIRDLTVANNNLKDSINTTTTARKDAAAVIEGNRTKQEKLNDELARLKTLRAELGEEEYAKAVSKTTEEIEKLKNEESGLTDITDAMGSSFEDTFESFILGSTKASDAARSFALALAKIALQKAIIGPMSDSLFGGSSGGGGLFGSLVSGVSSYFTGGQATGTARFAAGGRPTPGEVSMVGERGPELFVPDSAGSIIPNKHLNGGGGGPTVYADMRGASVDAVARLETFVQELNGSIEPRSVAAVADARQRNPSLLGGA